ncbi:MAG: TGS domain-containing protein, partial [Planctomycetota bacterium]
MKVQLPDGTLVEHADDATALDVANGISERLAQQVVAAEVASVTGEWAIYDATRPLAELTTADPVPVKLLTER